MNLNQWILLTSEYYSEYSVNIGVFFGEFSKITLIYHLEKYQYCNPY